MSAVSAKYQMWGAELMRKGEKENLRIQLGERFYDYVEKCRKFLGWKQMKICEAIANSMNGEEIGTEKKLKANTIYQYKQKGVSGKQAENLLNACIEFHITYHVPRIELSQFVTEYKEIARKLLKREVNIDTSGLPYVVEYSHELSEEEKEEWDRVVCPDKLRKKLDDFFKKESKCMIIQGTRKSGITVSVEKYLLDKQKGQETIIIPYIYDIEQMEYSNTMEQQLRKDLQGDYVVIRIGYGKFDHYDFLKNAKAKILILSHSMAGIDASAEAETLVFNDLTNNMQCTRQMLEEYVPELDKILNKENSETKETMEIALNKFHDITGGIPIAVKKIGELIWKLYHVDGIGMEQILKETLWKNEKGKETYQYLWNELMEDMWNRIGETERKVLERIACIATSVSKKMMWSLNNMNPDGNIMDNMLHNLFLMEGGKTRNSDAPYPGVRLFPLMRNLILYKLSTDVAIDEEKFYKETMERAIRYLEEALDSNEMAGIYKGKMCFLDREGEFQVVKSILEFCCEDNIEKYMMLTMKLEPYFSLRGKDGKYVREIYENRLRVARDNNFNRDVLTSYGYIINQRILRGENNLAENDFHVSLAYVNRYKLKEALSPAYLLMKVKYNIYIGQDYGMAEKILQQIPKVILSNLQKAEAEFYSWICQWKLSQEIDIEKLKNKIDIYLTEGDVDNNIIEIQYGLVLAELCIEQYLKDTHTDAELGAAESVLRKVEDYINACRYPVAFQQSCYYFNRACIAKIQEEERKFNGVCIVEIQKEEWRLFMNKAQRAYKRTDRGIWKKQKEEYLNNIEKIIGEKWKNMGNN